MEDMAGKVKQKPPLDVVVSQWLIPFSFDAALVLWFCDFCVGNGCMEQDIRRILNRKDFIPMIVNFDTDSLQPSTRDKVAKEYLNDSKLSDEIVERASKACGPLFKWVRSQVEFAEILQRVQPLREKMSKVEEEGSVITSKREDLDATIEELEKKIAVYKEEYATLIREEENLRREINSVQSRLHRAEALIEGLSSEGIRWKETAESFDSVRSALVGNALRCAALLAYGGIMDVRGRKALHEMVSDVLSFVALPYTEALSLPHYLMSPSTRLRWGSCGLGEDGQAIENATVLCHAERFPLIVDPTGAALSFIVKALRQGALPRAGAMNSSGSGSSGSSSNGKQRSGSNYAQQQTTATVTSFLDNNFVKMLENALRNGTALVATDVDAYDPILNPVLNREFQTGGGRVTVRLGTNTADVSPSFSLYLLTRDPTPRFPPDLASRVTFVNFTLTESSLADTVLSRSLRSERPEVDAARRKLLQLQGEAQVRWGAPTQTQPLLFPVPHCVSLIHLPPFHKLLPCFI